MSDPVFAAIGATLAFFAGTVVGAYFLEREHKKELAQAQGCPRCIQFHQLANAARRLKGLSFKPKDAEQLDPNDVVLKALNDIAQCKIPPPINVISLKNGNGKKEVR